MAFERRHRECKNFRRPRRRGWDLRPRPALRDSGRASRQIAHRGDFQLMLATTKSSDH